MFWCGRVRRSDIWSWWGRCTVPHRSDAAYRNVSSVPLNTRSFAVVRCPARPLGARCAFSSSVSPYNRRTVILGESGALNFIPSARRKASEGSRCNRRRGFKWRSCQGSLHEAALARTRQRNNGRLILTSYRQSTNSAWSVGIDADHS